MSTIDAKKIYIDLKNDKAVKKDKLASIQASIEKLIGIDPLPYPMRKRQIQAILSFICHKNNVSCFLPTNYGKTIIAILCGLYMYYMHGTRTIIIGLLKALTSEQRETFSKFAKTIISDGDHKNVDFDCEWVFCCMTPEKFDSIMCNSQNREKLTRDVGLIVNDEVHSAGDENRGHVIENYIIILKMLYPNMRYVNLSATVGNPEEFSNWLGTDLIYAHPEERPIPLKLNVIKYKEVTYGYSKKPNFKANYKLKVDMLRRLIKQNPDKNWLIFVTARNRTQSIPYDLAGVRNKRGLDHLMKTQKMGYHHAGLTLKEKKKVQNAFLNGDINVVVATTTLATGVNLPADCTVLFGVFQFTELKGQEVINANRIQQTMGRAGRSGFSKIGYAYIFVPERLYDEIYHRATTPLTVVSQLKPRLHAKILQWFSASIVETIKDLIKIASYSYAKINEEEIKNAVNYLITFGFIEEIKKGKYQLTPLGFQTNKMYVTPEMVVFWNQQVENIQDITDIKELFIRFTSIPEYMNILSISERDTNVIKYGTSELGNYFPETDLDINACVNCALNNKCDTLSITIKRCEAQEFNFHTMIPEQIKKAFFLTFYNDLYEKYIPLTLNKYTGKMERKGLYLSSGDITTLKRAGERIFTAASVIFGNNKALGSSLKTLSSLVSAGTFNKSVADLMELDGIGIVYALKLVKSKIKTQGDFMDLTKFKLANILEIKPATAEKLINKNYTI
jgi:replicative superfamily II helicase